jgi:hypothetical protein
MTTDRHKNRNVIHINNESHAILRAEKKRTGKQLGTIVEELIIDEVAQNGRRKELRDRALAAQGGMGR